MDIWWLAHWWYCWNACGKKVKMTAMPEMVSLFNGMGGACAALISLQSSIIYMHIEIENGWQAQIFGSIPVNY